jgi:hypothetical protein
MCFKQSESIFCLKCEIDAKNKGYENAEERYEIKKDRARIYFEDSQRDKLDHEDRSDF